MLTRVLCREVSQEKASCCALPRICYRGRLSRKAKHWVLPEPRDRGKEDSQIPLLDPENLQKSLYAELDMKIPTSHAREPAEGRRVYAEGGGI